MTEVNEDLRKAWIKALESGKYLKTKGRLRLLDEWCCLGVLIDQALKLKLIEGKWVNDWLFDYTEKPLGCNKIYRTFPPDCLYQMVGLTKSQATTLASINDYSASFKDVIQELKRLGF